MTFPPASVDTGFSPGGHSDDVRAGPACFSSSLPPLRDLPGVRRRGSAPGAALRKAKEFPYALHGGVAPDGKPESRCGQPAPPRADEGRLSSSHRGAKIESLRATGARNGAPVRALAVNSPPAGPRAVTPDQVNGAPIRGHWSPSSRDGLRPHFRRRNMCFRLVLPWWYSNALLRSHSGNTESTEAGPSRDLILGACSRGPTDAG